MGIAMPSSTAIDFQEHCKTEIRSYVESIHKINKQFNKVRDVVKWFGEHNVTPAAAVYYWPTILCLLPADHDVHKTDWSALHRDDNGRWGHYPVAHAGNRGDYRRCGTMPEA